MRYRWHLGAALVVFVLTTLFLIAQTVTTADGAPIPLRRWLNPIAAIRILANLRKPAFIPSLEKVIFVQDNAVFQNPSVPKNMFALPTNAQNEFVFSPNGKLVAYRTDARTVGILPLDGSAPITLPNPDATAVNIIHWNADSSALYLARKKETWSILRVSTDGTTTALVEGIRFPHDLLTISYSPLNTYLVYPDCPKFCRFVAVSLADPQRKAEIAAIRDGAEGDIVPNLNFAFFSEQDNLLGYWITEDTRPFRFLVTQHHGLTDEPNPTLLQVVHLDANRARLLNYAGFAQNSKQMLFTTRPENTDRQEFFAYSAVKPALTILKSVEKVTDAALMLNSEGTYQVGRTLYSVQNPQWTNVIKDNLSFLVHR